MANSSTVLAPGQRFANIALSVSVGQITSAPTRTLRKRRFSFATLGSQIPTSSHFARTPIPPRLICTRPSSNIDQLREKVGKGVTHYNADSIFTSDIVKRENAREGMVDSNAERP